MKVYENLDINDLDGETWKIIKDFPDYQISNLCRIKSFKKHNGIDKRILKQYKDRKEYFYIVLYKNKKSKHKLVHILLYETFNDYKLKDDECIHHKDENRKNNNLDNFRLMTKKDHLSLHHKNKIISKKIRKLWSKKRKRENNSNSKLKDGEVWLIKKILDSDYYKSGRINQTFIGKMFGVNQMTISHIKTGKLWSCIEF